MKNYILFENQQTNLIFDEQIDKITGKINTMGLIEQIREIKIQEVREEEAKRFIENLLSSTDFSVEKIASLAGVPVDFVEKVKKGAK